MKKLLSIFISFVVIFTFTACKKVNNINLDEFYTQASIEETLLYNENNVKITANELTYSDYSADLSITIENNSDMELSLICGSAGYHVNSINGYMVDDGYLNCKLSAGQSATDTISFKFNSIIAYGITSIADIEIGFNIQNENSVTYTGPLKLKTSIADSYDYSANRYRKVLNNGAFEAKFNSKMNYFSEDKLLETSGLCVTSAAVITNTDGKPILLLEIENTSDEQIFINTNKVHLNNYLVYDSLWSSDNLNPSTKYVIDMSLADIANKYEGAFEDVSKISAISFTLNFGTNRNNPQNSQEISITLPDIEVSAKQN